MTAPTNNCFDPEQKKIFVMSYIFIILQRSYGHSLEQLTMIDYLPNDQMSFIDLMLIKQLNAVAQEVSQRRCKNALGQMFSIETALVKKTLLEWFNKKIKSQHLEADLLIKNQYKRKHPIDWQTDKCTICKLLLKTDPLGYNVLNSEMSYGYFFSRYKHIFLTNIYSNSEIAKSPQICTLQNYYVVYQKFIKVCISLLALLGNSHINKDEDQFDRNLRDFLQEKYPETDLEELRSKTDNVEIKNIIKSTNYNKIPRFNLKGNILGYAHDFCNWNVCESKTEIAMIAHNLFGFDMFFFFIKGFHAIAWGTEDLNVGRTNLTHINYGNIAAEIKFIDTLKYYQKSLGELAATLSDEKISIKHLTK